VSILDMSLVKAPYGKGTNSPATINGWPFEIDPSSVQLPIRAKVQKYRTIGGFVVQVYGTTWGDLTVSGQFGTGGWQAQLNFLDRMVQLARDQAIQRKATVASQNFTPSQPFRFTYPLLSWDFLCYLKAYTSPDGPAAVHYENTNINPKWALTLFVVTDNGSLTEVTKTAYLQRLAPGLGFMWDSKATNGADPWQGYTQDQYDAPLTSNDVQNAIINGQAYTNSPNGGSNQDVVSATPANLTGPQTTPPASGSTTSGDLVINTASDFATALIKQLGITPVNQTISVNLVRAWECQEGMWSQPYFDQYAGTYIGGSKLWWAPNMNNPLNIGGWTGYAQGVTGTYQSWPYTVLNAQGVTGATFSFNGNWANGVAATAYALEHENASWPAIVTALQESSPSAFFAAVGQWNPGAATSYAAKVEAHYNSGDYVGTY
jgi:hypothetical protein